MTTPAPRPDLRSPDLLEDVRLDELLVLGKPWTLLVWDDPVNLMNYVTWVFTSYFGFPKPKAERLMMQVHTEGRAAVHSGTREEIERHVEAMHGYGLQATMEQVDA